MASHSVAGSSTTQSQSNQIQINIIKTMILVSTFYTISDMPMTMYSTTNTIHNLGLPLSGYYAFAQFG